MGIFGLFKPNIKRMEKKKNIKGLLKALEHDITSIQEEAAKALGRIGDASAVEPLIKLLNPKKQISRLISIRGFAVDVLGDIGDARAVEPLIESLRWDDAYVQKKAIWALGKIGDKRALEWLILELQKSPDGDFRSAAADAIDDIGDASAVEPLIEALEDKDEYVQRRSLLALGKIGGERALEALIEALKSEKRDDPPWAAVALGDLGDPRAVEPLLDGLKTDIPNTIRQVSEALSKIGTKHAVDALISKLLTITQPNLKIIIAEALEKIGDERVIEAYIQVLKKRDKDVQEKLTELLIKIGKPAVPYLKQALRDENQDLRKYAALALREIEHQHFREDQ